MWRHIASNAVTVLILALFLLGGVILWGRGQYTGSGPLAEAICLQVPTGGTIDGVSRDLEARGAISSGVIFRLGVDYEERGGELKAGSFLIQPSSSMDAIVDEITGDGRSTCGTQVRFLVRVNDMLIRVRELDPETQDFETIAEFDAATGEVPAEFVEAAADVASEFTLSVAPGVTSWQVVDALQRVSVLEGEIEEVPPEGALAPITVEIRPGDVRTDLLAQMQEEQIDRVSEAWAGRDPDLPLETPEELVTLASIIEKETATPEERELVSSVFVNRLNTGMRLQTDPTVIYGITEGRGILGRGIRQSELRRETPWNTYVIQGLPPTPIANPDMASLMAAANPAETDFLFFVAKSLDPSDGHNFAVTLDEHNRNVAAYRALEAARTSNN